MMRKAVFGVMLALLLTSILTVFNVQAVEVIGPIYIRPNGSVDPLTAPILRAGDLYTLTDNITITPGDANGIVIERDSIMLDGAGYTIQSIGSYFVGIGIDVSGRTNVTIKNIQIESFSCGIWLNSSSNNKISRNKIESNRVGIQGYSSNFNSISGNNITANRLNGISLNSSSNNNISRNIVTANLYNGIWLCSSSNFNSISENNITDNLYFGIVLLSSSDHNSISGNNIANNQDGISVSSNNSILENTITGNNRGVYIYNTTNNNLVSGNNIANNTEGFSLFSSSNNTISGNNIVNCQYGLWLTYSSNCSIFGNNMANNVYGIRLASSNSNKIFHNSILSNAIQVYKLVQIPYNTWDDGYPSGGNFWSDYAGVDANGDGIGDTPYTIDANNQDRYPLIVPDVWNYSNPSPIVWNGTVYWITLSGNSTISAFKFNQLQKQISFNVTGTSGTTGYCNVTIPKQLLWVDSPAQWIVLVGGLEVTPTVTEDANNTYLYFTYSHSTKTIQIIGTGVVPEFPPSTIMPLLMILTLLAMVFAKRRFPRKLKI